MDFFLFTICHLPVWSSTEYDILLRSKFKILKFFEFLRLFRLLPASAVRYIRILSGDYSIRLDSAVHINSSRFVPMICGVTIFEMPRCDVKQQQVFFCL